MSDLLDPGSARRVGTDLTGAEGVCVAGDGSIWVGDRRSLVAKVAADGSPELHGRGGVQPGGVAFDKDGRVLVADYGPGEGLKRLDLRTGLVEVLASEVGGVPVMRANYPAIDGVGRIWCTNSTGHKDDWRALKENVADGFVFVADEAGQRIVLTGLRFANGLAFSRGYEWLYIAESSGPGVLRARVEDGGRLGEPEQFGPDLGGTTDGLAFDEEGNLWVTMVFDPKALVVIDPSGEATIVLEDRDGSVIGDPTNIAFGGDDMRDLYVTSPAMDHLMVFRTSIPGMPL